MQLKTKRSIIGGLGVLFLISLVVVQAVEMIHRKEQAGLTEAHIDVPFASRSCVECHEKLSPGIIDHWMGSTHAKKDVGCVKCHQAIEGDVDAFRHHGELIATVVTPKDCGRCHEKEQKEFAHSHHAKAGNILASLDNTIAQRQSKETVHRSIRIHPHQENRTRKWFNGMASVFSGCMQCHGSKVALLGKDGSMINVDVLKPDPQTGQPTNLAVLDNIARDDKEHRPLYHPNTWPNTGIGRLNLDGSRGSCSACHSRHDFSPRRARQPENCGKCHSRSRSSSKRSL